MISIINEKYKLNSFLGVDIIKQYLKDKADIDMVCVTYQLYVHNNMYHELRKNEFDNGEVVCEIGYLVNILQIIKNYEDGVEDLSTGLIMLDDDQWKTVHSVIENANSIDINNIEIFGFSSLYITFLYLFLYAAIIKRRNPNIKIVFGGYHVTLSERIRKLLLKTNIVDITISGDGCKPMLDIAQGKITEGDYFGKFEQTPSLPHYTKIRRRIGPPNFSTLSSVGCKFNCYFCASSREFIECDLDYLKKYIERENKIYRINHISFADDCINPTISRAIALCNVMKNFPSITWNAHFVCSQYNDKLLEALVDSGCTELFLGTEAFSDDILDVINKNCNKKKYLETIHKLCDAGIKVVLGIICGLPSETDEKFQETLDVVINLVKNYEDLITIAPVCIKMFPGSEMYKKPDKFGISFTYWSKDIINKYWKYKIEEEFPELLPLIETIPFLFSIEGVSGNDRFERQARFLPFKKNLLIYGNGESLSLYNNVNELKPITL
jgi:uncharacterized radical SAM superfamily protein